MKISYNWLKKYLDFNDSPETLATVLTDIGLEVEGVSKIEGVKGGLKGVVVGEVLSCVKHPGADKLKLTEVNIGSSVHPIVCGAPNVAAGQKVLVATVGATIYPNGEKEGLKIKKARIRGEVSEGMICAEDELGLGTSHDGILVLHPSAIPGTPASEFLELDTDHQIEIGLTPNRADAMSHIGVARDLKAYYNYRGAKLNLKWPAVSDIPTGKNPVDVRVEDTNGCPKYLGLFFRNVKVGESPDWLKKQLLAIGLSPINNVVDITNFVLHETGQPLHAFDGSVVNGQIVVRTANTNEKFKTLDGVERELGEGDLLICNASRPMCIAGVFGGEESGVTDKTTTVFLEGAWFDPVTIRKGAKRHGLNTDASFRFERTVDPNVTEYAMKRAAGLFKEICGADLEGDMTVFSDREFAPFSVRFQPEKASRLVGESIKPADFQMVFSELDMEVSSADTIWNVKVPYFRVDVQREADLVEEFLRIYGYNAVSIPSKISASVQVTPEKDSHKLYNAVADHLTAKGYSEILNNSLVAGKSVPDSDNAVQLLNPLSNELDVMRRSLLPGMLATVAYNQNRQSPDLKLYEYGNTYQRAGERFFEKRRLSMLVTGNKHGENWSEPTRKSTYYTLKGNLESVLNSLGLVTKYGASKESLLEDGIGYYIGKEHVADCGWVKKETLKSHGIKAPVYYAALDWDKVMTFYSGNIRYRDIPKYPEVRRDLSLLIDDSVSFDEIRNIALQSEKELLKNINLFDVYEGDKLEKNKKSYAVSFSLQDTEQTLTDKKVDKVMERIIQNLMSNLGASLR